MNNIVAYLQNQINNITANNPPGNDEPDIGTMWTQNIIIIFYQILKPIIYTNMWKWIFAVLKDPETIKPPPMQLSKSHDQNKRIKTNPVQSNRNPRHCVCGINGD